MAVTMRTRGGSYSAYWREDGKVKEISLGNNLRLAKIEVADIEKRLMAKKNGAEKEITWLDFVDQYLNCCQADLAKDTVVRNRVVFNNFNKTITIRYLKDLSPEILEEYKIARKNYGTGGSTINREITTIKSAMKKAGEWGYAATNIWGVRKMPTVKKRPVFFTLEDLDAMLKAADPYWQTVIHIGVYVGLRRGEMLNLDWKDMDFQNEIIRIVPNEHWQPKDREAREIPMHPILKDHLSRWQAASKNGHSKVIPWSFKPLAFSQSFTRLIRRAGIDKGSLHSLRHSFASHLAMAGIDLLRIGRMMGHSTVVTTQIYAHLLNSSLKEAIVYFPDIQAGLSKNGSTKKEKAADAPVPAPSPIPEILPVEVAPELAPVEA